MCETRSHCFVLSCCRETVRLLKRLHQWDVLRANKAPFAWGVETRVPFLDKTFLDLVMNIDPAEKMVRRLGTTQSNNSKASRSRKSLLSPLRCYHDQPNFENVSDLLRILRCDS